MATRKLELTGIAEWAKVFTQNRDLTGYKPVPSAEGSYEKYNGACTLNIIIDDANLAAMQASGCPKQPKADPEGRGWIVKFDRKFDTGQDYASGPPTVTHSDGSAWDFVDDGLIGNGSTIDISVTVYDIPKYGKVGSRLDTVVVTDHVMVEGAAPEIFSARTVNRLDKEIIAQVSLPKNTAAAVSSPPADGKLDDEIMF